MQKLLNFRNILRDDGVSTIEYVEQLTYLLFLKMADERLKAGLGESGPVRARLAGTLGTIFRKAQNRIQDPAKLRRLLVNLIKEETWTSVDTGVKGDPPGRCGGHEVGRRSLLHAASVVCDEPVAARHRHGKR